MRIVLHVGAHRTATTTLQRTLAAGQPDLRTAQVRYWGPKRVRTGLFRGLYGGAGPGCDARQGEGRVRLRLHDAAAAGTVGVFVSEENMLGTMRGCLSARCLYPDAGSRVARFAAPFAGHDVTLALAIRRYDLWWASALAFLMPRGGPLPEAEVVRALSVQPRRWRHVVSDIAGAVPWARLVVWPFEGSAPWSAEHLSALLRQEVPLDGAAGWHNRAMGLADLRQLALEAGASACIIAEERGRFMPFDTDQRRHLQAAYAGDLAWLRAGADGAAEFLETPDPVEVGATGSGRGTRDERRQWDEHQHRRLARSR